MNRKNFPALLCALLIVSLLHVLVYAAVRLLQHEALEAPPARAAEEAAYRLARGTDPKDLLPPADPQRFASGLLSTFVLDASGRVLAADARVGTRTIPVPAGLLDHARRNGIKKVTWHPWPGLRKALVIRYLPAGDRFVAVAGPYDDTPNPNFIWFLCASWLGCGALLSGYALWSGRRSRIPAPSLSK
ncbi:hypothetical protein [Flaviaesturariibacter amylovorans]|uniref:DUF3592 domain-containing protein n=1 Tax=Flaviaesturariibacter amylovorans TaxID=1084520 RepID=A0ABP8GD97_9BACT